MSKTGLDAGNIRSVYVRVYKKEDKRERLVPLVVRKVRQGYVRVVRCRGASVDGGACARRNWKGTTLVDCTATQGTLSRSPSGKTA